MILVATAVLAALASAGWTTAVIMQRRLTATNRRLTAEVERNTVEAARHARFVADHMEMPLVTDTQAQAAVRELYRIVHKGETSRQLRGWVSADRVRAVLDDLEQAARP